MGARTGAGVSRTGLTGALFGFIPALGLGTYLLFSQRTEAHPAPELMVLMGGAMYLPALWASVTPTPVRRIVLLATSLLMLLLSLALLPVLFGPTILLFTLPPAFLLLVGAAISKEQHP